MPYRRQGSQPLCSVPCQRVVRSFLTKAILVSWAYLRVHRANSEFGVASDLHYGPLTPRALALQGSCS